MDGRNAVQMSCANDRFYSSELLMKIVMFAFACFSNCVLAGCGTPPSIPTDLSPVAESHVDAVDLMASDVGFVSWDRLSTDGGYCGAPPDTSECVENHLQCGETFHPP